MNTTPHISPDFAKGARLGDAVELAASLGVCKNTVWNHVGARRIPAVRIGSVVRFHLPSVLSALGVKQIITALLLLATSACVGGLRLGDEPLDILLGEAGHQRLHAPAGELPH